MAKQSIFPEDMLNKSTGDMTLESIAGKLTYLHEAFHLCHWQTTSIAEHGATGSAYDYIHGFKDGFMEKLMGYTGKRPSGYRVDPISPVPAASIASEAMSFASQLKAYGESNGFHDVCNMADEFHGEVAKLKYLLTLS